MTQTVLLAIDTSTEYCSVALLRSAHADDAVSTPQTWFRHELTGAVSSTRVLPAIQELFAESGLTLADCDAVAFGAGPGSFTGCAPRPASRRASRSGAGCRSCRSVRCSRVPSMHGCAHPARRACWPRSMRGWTKRTGRTSRGRRRGRLAHAAARVARRAGRRRRARRAVYAGGQCGRRVRRAAAGDDARGVDRRRRAAACARGRACRAARVSRRARGAGRAGRAEYVRDKVAQTTAERVAARAAQTGGAYG